MRFSWVLIGLLLLLICVPAYAGAGAVPTAIGVIPAGWLLFPVAVLIKAIVGLRILRLDWRKAFGLSAQASLVSILLGIPVLTILLGILAVSIVRPGGGWLSWIVGNMAFIPIEGELSPDSAVYGTLALFSAVFLITSVLVDWRIALVRVQDEAKQDVKRWSLVSNSIVYGPLLAWMLILVATNLKRLPR